MKSGLGVRTVISIVCVLLFACRSDKQKNGGAQEPAADVMHQPESRELQFGEVIDTTSWCFVPLETSDRSLMGKVQQLLIQDSFMLVSAYEHPKRVLMFDRKGKFIREIGRNGKGPGEYIRINNIGVRPEQQEIMVNDPDGEKMLLYDYEGNFKYAVPLQREGECVMLKNGKYLQVCLELTSEDSQNPAYVVLNEKGEVLYGLLPRPQGKSRYIVFYHDFGKFALTDQYAYFIPVGQDTLYRMALHEKSPEALLCFGLKKQMRRLDMGSGEAERKKYRIFEHLAVNETGDFSCEISKERKTIFISGNLRDGVRQAGYLGPASEKYRLENVTGYRDGFAGIMPALEAVRFHSHKVPDMTDESNPVVVFFKFKS